MPPEEFEYQLFSPEQNEFMEDLDFLMEEPENPPEDPDVLDNFLEEYQGEFGEVDYLAIEFEWFLENIHLLPMPIVRSIKI